MAFVIKVAKLKKTGGFHKEALDLRAILRRQKVSDSFSPYLLDA